MRFIVKNFGPIKSADVSLRDFNVFIGPAGTGKSYLAYLIWMLLKMEPKWETLVDFTTSKIFTDITMEIVNNKEISKEKSEQLLAELMDNAQKAHEEHIVEYLKDTFRIDNPNNIICENENEAVIKICNDEDTKNIEIIINKSGVRITGFRELLDGENFVIKYQKEQRKIALYNGEKELTKEYIPVKDHETDVEEIIRALVNIIVPMIPTILVETLGFSTALDPCILTDSKSGILRLAPSLLRYSLTTKGVKEIPFNSPDRAMLTELIMDKKEIKDKEFYKIANFIEEEMGGIIDMELDFLLFPEIYFKKGEHIYPILRSHSGAREIAPLILYLKYVLDKETVLLVIEEPETHLHPNMQSIVTRALGLLSRSIPILTTTHSPIILDELNNLIKLNKLSPQDKRKTRYRETEGLDYASVKVYRFRTDGRVEEIRVNEDGFYEDEFSSVVIELSNKYAEVEELLWHAKTHA